MYSSHPPTAPAAAAAADDNSITCVSCGRRFPFDQTVEGRCLRDHALHAERERTRDAARSSSGGGNVTVTGPTISLQQSTSAAATATAGGYAPRPYIVAAPRRSLCARLGRRTKTIACLVLFALAAFGLVVLLRNARVAKDGHGATPQHQGNVSSTSTTASFAPSTVHSTRARLA